MAELTRVQTLHLELIRCVSFNDFDGAVVADGLLAHSDLWVAAIAAHSQRPHPVYRLFEEIPEDEWSPDTLWIMVVDEEAAHKIASLCREWNADKAGIYDFERDEQMSDITMVDDEVLVRAWWD